VIPPEPRLGRINPAHADRGRAGRRWLAVGVSSPLALAVRGRAAQSLPLSSGQRATRLVKSRFSPGRPVELVFHCDHPARPSW